MIVEEDESMKKKNYLDNYTIKEIYVNLLLYSLTISICFPQIIEFEKHRLKQKTHFYDLKEEAKVL